MAVGKETEEVFLGEQLSQHRAYGEATADEVDKEVRSICAESFNRATDTLSDNRDALEQVARDLLEKDEIAGERVLELVTSQRRQAGHEAHPPQ